MTKTPPSKRRKVRAVLSRVIRDEAYVRRMQVSDQLAADEASDLLAQAAASVKRRKLRAKPQGVKPLVHALRQFGNPGKQAQAAMLANRRALRAWPAGDLS